MSILTINFSDPIKASKAFSIVDRSFDGPGGPSSNSTLNLYGNSTLNWGLGFDENFLHLAENFAGATPPIIPVEGQIWYSIRLYWFNTTTNHWFRWNYTTLLWDDITASVTSGLFSARPALSSVGNYYYATDTQALYRWDSAYQQIPNGWMLRYFTSSTSDPSGIPAHQLLSWDGTSWSTAAGVTAQSTPPSSPQIGQLWYDTSVNKLKEWNGSSWQVVGGVTSFNTRTGDITLTSGDVTTALGGTNPNVGTFGDSTHSVTVAVTGAGLITSISAPAIAFPVTSFNTRTGTITLTSGDVTGALTYTPVNKAGDTMTGLLILSADPVAALGATTKQYTDTQAKWQGGARTFSTGLPSGGSNGDVWFQYS